MKPSERLTELLAARDSLLIAYSGGVDSALLTHLAAETLGSGQVKCVLLDAPVVPRREVEEAVKTAEWLGVICEVIPFPILEDAAFCANPPGRCYFCKKASAKVLRNMATKAGISDIADGVNLSDLGEYRPGIAACDEEEIVHPFVEAGLRKEDIRQLARECGLPFWNKPSAACLSSRIPYGDSITPEKLRMIERAEEVLKTLGFDRVRVRLHGGIARIEIPPGAFERLLAARGRITEALRQAGFGYIVLDLDGYRSGSMNEVL